MNVRPLIVLVMSLAALAQQTIAFEEAQEPNAVNTPTPEIKVMLPPGIGDKAAPLEGLQWVKGDAFRIEPGKPCLIEFWATWCGPCRETIPHLTELQARYGDKITIIGISNEKLETVKPFVERMGPQMGYRVAVDKQGKVSRNYSEAYGQQAIPHGFIVDQNGKIVWYGHPSDGMDYVLEQVAAGTFDALAYARKRAEYEALNKQLSQWFSQYFEKVKSEGASDETDRLAAAFIEKAHTDALMAFAWNNLTKMRNERSRAVALKAAQKANTLTEGREPMILDTYATALFENGKLEEAIAAEQKALDLSKDDHQMQQVYRHRLMEFKTKLYKTSKTPAKPETP